MTYEDVLKLVEQLPHKEQQRLLKTLKLRLKQPAPESLRSVLDFRGMARDTSFSIDAQAWVDQERERWDDGGAVILPHSGESEKEQNRWRFSMLTSPSSRHRL